MTHFCSSCIILICLITLLTNKFLFGSSSGLLNKLFDMCFVKSVKSSWRNLYILVSRTLNLLNYTYRYQSHIRSLIIPLSVFILSCIINQVFWFRFLVAIHLWTTDKYTYSVDSLKCKSLYYLVKVEIYFIQIVLHEARLKSYLKNLFGKIHFERDTFYFT